MKKTIILTISVLFIFSGCISTSRRDVNNLDISGEVFYKSYRYNNNIPIERCTPVSYELEELNEYFGGLPLVEVEGLTYGIPLDSFTHNIEEVNLHFPITNIRAIYDPIDQSIGCVYSVYRTVEGGYFYVMWIVYRDDPSAVGYSEHTPKSIPLVGQTLYLDKCPRNLDFSDIVIGESTAADVEKIDPYLCIISGGSIVSKSIIHPYSSICVTYEIDRSRVPYGERITREHLVVVEMYTSSNQSGVIREEDFP